MNTLESTRRLSWLSIFTSTGTLVCCALPAAMVAVGAGATLASLAGTFPQLIWLSQHKLPVFGLAAAMLAGAGVLQWRARKAPCPADPALARACERTRRSSMRIYLASVVIFAIGFFFAFVAAAAEHDMAKGMSMASPFGPYAMTRDGSGTSWQPEAAPMDGMMWHGEQWMVMAHGFANVIHDDQGGPRGDRKLFANSMAMLMANRRLGIGTLGLRAMLSLDPTMGKEGYPLLLQTGETADGHEHLVDRQHPHDAFMELSGSYSISLGERASVFAYAGLPGEPALGPPTFMHRFSGVRIPEAPITHHWLDSTHITMGVVTLGATAGDFKAEASWFNGREPDQYRWNIETRGFDSWSTRVSYNPSASLALQASYGELDSPEMLEPETRVKRTTASAMLHTSAAGRPWATTLAWGRNDKSEPGGESRKLDGWLLESTVGVTDTVTAFARLERVANDELFDHHHPLAGRVFRVGKLSIGGLYDFASTGPLKWSIGALASAFHLPAELKPEYGAHPRAYMIFLQARL